MPVAFDSTLRRRNNSRLSISALQSVRIAQIRPSSFCCHKFHRFYGCVLPRLHLCLPCHPWLISSCRSLWVRRRRVGFFCRWNKGQRLIFVAESALCAEGFEPEARRHSQIEALPNEGQWYNLLLSVGRASSRAGSSVASPRQTVPLPNNGHHLRKRTESDSLQARVAPE